MGIGKLAVLLVALVLAVGGIATAFGGGSDVPAGPAIELDDAVRKDVGGDDVLAPEDDDDDTGDGDRTAGNHGTSGGDNTRAPKAVGDGDSTRGNDGTSGGDNTGDGDNTAGNDGTSGGDNTGVGGGGGTDGGASDTGGEVSGGGTT